MANKLNFCESNDWYNILVAFSITYTPLMIYALKIMSGTIKGIFNAVIFINCAGCFVYLVWNHSSDHNYVAVSIGAATALIWGFYSLYQFCSWAIIRCRLCCLGRSYILAPPSHVDTSDGRRSLTTQSNTAFVIRKPGSTTVNGTLVPDLKSLVLGGRKAISKGAVNLLKYATK